MTTDNRNEEYEEWTLAQHEAGDCVPFCPHCTDLQAKMLKYQTQCMDMVFNAVLGRRK